MLIRSKFFFLYFLAAAVGSFAGLLAASFHVCLDFIAQQRLSLVSSTTAILPYIIGSALLVCLSLWLVRRFAPQASGSGIPRVEEVLAGATPAPWWRIIPVKFMGGICAIAPGLVLGREGPTIHMGAAIGQLFAGLNQLEGEHKKSLMAAGVGAGLAAAFNAPLAAIMLVTEEMRAEFNYNRVSLLCVTVASYVAVIVNSSWLGQGFQLGLAQGIEAPLRELPIFLLLGILVGVFAIFFNRCLLWTVSGFATLPTVYRYLAAAAVGALIGSLVWLIPDSTGGGEQLVQQLNGYAPSLVILVGLLLLRTLLTALCYGTGVPGGIFAPLLALGALLGLIFSEVVSFVLPHLGSTPAMFMVAAMGALFAGSVRAPMTGIILILELTGAFDASFSIMIACLGATMTAEGLGGQPIYQQLRNPISLPTSKQW